jgi:hypothetical protein
VRATVLIAIAIAIATVAVAGFVPAAVGAGRIDPVVLARPPFPPPVDGFRRPARPLLVVESSRYRAPGLATPKGADVAPSAPATFGGGELLQAIHQRGMTFLLYGADGASARYLVAVRAAKLLYAFDFGRYANAPDVAPAGRPYTTEQLLWAREVDGVVYVETAHQTYASASAGRNAYISAIDVPTGKLLWRSPALVANAATFVVAGDVIVSGYGFTSEPDYLFVLGARTGQVLDRLLVPSGPESIALHGDRLSVRTYDRSLIVRLRPR